MYIELDYLSGVRFQIQLYVALKEWKPFAICETGVATGCSSGWILKAIDENQKGRLWGIDSTYDQLVFHECYTYLKEFSTTGILKAFAESGPFDVFIHDSDHGLGCQTYEYEMGYALLRPGGWIVSDDTDWGIPPHGAWTRFCQKYGLTEIKIGCASAAKKPLKALPSLTTLKEAKKQHSLALKLADAACLEQGLPAYSLFLKEANV